MLPVRGGAEKAATGFHLWKALISLGFGEIGFVWSFVVERSPDVEKSLDAAR